MTVANAGLGHQSDGCAPSLIRMHCGKTLRKGTGGAACKGRACQAGFNSWLPDKSELV